jgi:hypothetical protein
MTRQTKTPAQRAQEQYDTALRVAERLIKKTEAAAAALEDLRAERDAAVARATFLSDHPDLPTQPTTNPSQETA